ncbi:MAG TPA: S-methyl-5'-thioadenosine phosphorylase [Candidatus Hydrogenedentes bacterium]|nr:S-methyl-5'-thioadenosine phosphorylase [Candidatus Hydrogenedentota bacterium]HPG70251.1 S-methyl-5'-thioadenosine phosphorylase [Candidatus Hydrogenedentota bacterium]
MTKVGIIGGSGLDNPSLLHNARDVEADTPFGAPSSPLKMGTIGGVEVALLARHGRQHTVTPTHVNNRANIWALKACGCTHIIASTAVGSLRDHIKRGDLVIVDQFIDFTRFRACTFHDVFEPGHAAHTAMADPFDKTIRAALVASAEALGVPFHATGTVITIEGPRFSTRAESRMYRIWGADIVNMSIAPEAALANEARVPYAAVAMSTDYDSWKEDEAPVTWEMILEIFHGNVENITRLIVNTIPRLV